MKEILLIDKPVGMSSFDVIRELRRKLGIRKMGHAGTLDPLASGLLIVGIGDGTKLLHEYLKLPKTYEAQVLLGECRSTGDMEGEILEKEAVVEIDEEKVRDTVASLKGELKLQVPRYAAVKVGGERLYKKARKGEDFEPPLKTMEILNSELLGIKKMKDGIVLKIVFDVGTGTYIRSLAAELGRRLGYPATVFSLRRTWIGDFKIEDAKRLDDGRKNG